ncbi:MAG: hypothetical protein ACRC8Y_02480 [Chroococcales cyanobacterium]
MPFYNGPSPPTPLPERERGAEPCVKFMAGRYSESGVPFYNGPSPPTPLPERERGAEPCVKFMAGRYIAVPGLTLTPNPSP